MTVAHAVVGDSFTQPHDEERARGIDHGHEKPRQPRLVEKELRLDGTAGAGKVDDDTDGLDNRQKDSEISRILRNLFLSLFALLGEPFERGNTHAEKLHDNGSVDVRPDTQGKQRTVGKRAAVMLFIRLRKSFPLMLSSNVDLANPRAQGYSSRYGRPAAEAASSIPYAGYL